MDRKYTWDDLYERADGAAYGDDELTAKDNARWQLTCLIIEEDGYDIDECECPEDEIDTFLWKRENLVLFDVDGNIVEK